MLVHLPREEGHGVIPRTKNCPSLAGLAEETGARGCIAHLIERGQSRGRSRAPNCQSVWGANVVAADNPRRRRYVNQRGCLGTTTAATTALADSPRSTERRTGGPATTAE